MASGETVDKGVVEVRTTIDASHYSADIDLSDIGDMIKRYCNEVERLEERIDNKDNRIVELEQEVYLLKRKLTKQV